MKHFVIEVTYTAPLATIEHSLAAHRAFLQTGYDAQRLLMSGPQNPRIGGLIIARGESLEEVQAFFARDPFQTGKIATYRFIEFAPVKFAPCVTSWIS